MFSRATLWRRKKLLKEILSQRLANTVSTFDENFLGSTSSDFFQDTNLETSSDEAHSFNHVESQSHFSMSSHHYNKPKIDDELEGESDFYDENMWLEENVTDTDLWKNVEFEPAYPVVENEFLFNEITPSSIITYLCSICCEISTSSHNCNNVNCNQHSCFHISPLNYLRLPILPQLREILAHVKELNFQQQREFSPDIEMMNDIYDGEKYQSITVVIKPKSKKKIRVFPLLPAHQQQSRLRTNETYDIFMNTYEKERFTNNNELRDRLRGHIGPCTLRSLTYFDVGTSFFI
ncbi:unnamed protein product [Rotaria magnacalcarata]|uniref:Uncharacterized protein n=1 Tax=Rotaria magnacalcarata TaxID=392030 RepID=A0A819RWK9_9BILA|nr:unnamed protein product [Rotaria magnacalcarata]